MAPGQPLTPLRFPTNFFVNDIHELPERAREDLCIFLEGLQKNPYSPSILSYAERHGDKYAAEFSRDYIIYWRLVEEEEKLERIDILKIVRFDALFHEH
jgi:hypothetical protein